MFVFLRGALRSAHGQGKIGVEREVFPGFLPLEGIGRDLDGDSSAPEDTGGHTGITA